MTGQDIKSRRKALKWSQQELGQLIGIADVRSAKVLISKYETAPTLAGVASPERLAAIDKALTDEEQLRREFEAYRAGRLGK